MNAEFSTASSLPMFIQFLSSSFTGFILCSQRLFEIFAAPSLRISSGISTGLSYISQPFSSVRLPWAYPARYDYLMMDTLMNRFRKLPLFFLYLLNTEFHHTEQVFISEHITDRIYYIYCSVWQTGKQFRRKDSSKIFQRMFHRVHESPVCKLYLCHLVHMLHIISPYMLYTTLQAYRYSSWTALLLAASPPSLRLDCCKAYRWLSNFRLICLNSLV